MRTPASRPAVVGEADGYDTASVQLTVIGCSPRGLAAFRDGSAMAAISRAAVTRVRRGWERLFETPEWKRARAMMNFLETGDVDHLLAVLHAVDGTTALAEGVDRERIGFPKEIAELALAYPRRGSWRAFARWCVAVDRASDTVVEYRQRQRQEASLAALARGAEVDDTRERVRVLRRLTTAELFLLALE